MKLVAGNSNRALAPTLDRSIHPAKPLNSRRCNCPTEPDPRFYPEMTELRNVMKTLCRNFVAMILFNMTSFVPEEGKFAGARPIRAPREQRLRR